MAEKEPGPQGTSPVASPDIVEPEKRERVYKDFAHDDDGPSSLYFFLPFFGFAVRLRTYLQRPSLTWTLYFFSFFSFSFFLWAHAVA